MKERVQKVLARAGVASRREIERRIHQGRVSINGKRAEIGDRIDLSVDAVKVDGRRVEAPAPQRRYLLLNKPGGCVSSCHDPEGRPTVIDCIPAHLRKGLVPVGRLDYDTEGLMVLTDDGDLANRIAHPRYGCTKRYEVKVKGRPEGAAIGKLTRGIVINGAATSPARITAIDRSTTRGAVKNSWWSVVLREGKSRQIREMFFRIGHPVARLRRVGIGSVSDKNLKAGSFRHLTDDEVERLRRGGR